jgi:hypothetical protein
LYPGTSTPPAASAISKMAATRHAFRRFGDSRRTMMPPPSGSGANWKVAGVSAAGGASAGAATGGGGAGGSTTLAADFGGIRCWVREGGLHGRKPGVALGRTGAAGVGRSLAAPRGRPAARSITPGGGSRLGCGAKLKQSAAARASEARRAPERFGREDSSTGRVRAGDRFGHRGTSGLRERTRRGCHFRYQPNAGASLMPGVHSEYSSRPRPRSRAGRRGDPGSLQ